MNSHEITVRNNLGNVKVRIKVIPQKEIPDAMLDRMKSMELDDVRNLVKKSYGGNVIVLQG